MIGKRKLCTVRLKAVTSALLVLLVLTAGCNWGTEPEEEVKNVFAMRFYPSDVELEGADDIATVDIMVDHASSLVAAHFVISYDPSIVEVTRVQTSGFGLLFTDDGADVQEVESSIDNASGLVTVGIGGVRTGYQGANGSGSLAIITFKGKAVGEGALQFIKNAPDDLFTANYSSRSETGWLKQNAVSYNSTITVSEKPVEEPKVEAK